MSGGGAQAEIDPGGIVTEIAVECTEYGTQANSFRISTFATRVLYAPALSIFCFITMADMGDS